MFWFEDKSRPSAFSIRYILKQKHGLLNLRISLEYVPNKGFGSSLFRMVFRLRALAVGQTDGAGERSGGAKAVGGTYPPVPSPFSERKKSICP